MLLIEKAVCSWWEQQRATLMQDDISYVRGSARPRCAPTRAWPLRVDTRWSASRCRETTLPPPDIVKLSEITKEPKHQTGELHSPFLLFYIFGGENMLILQTYGYKEKVNSQPLFTVLHILGGENIWLFYKLVDTRKTRVIGFYYKLKSPLNTMALNDLGLGIMG